ncbi:MAG: hypothetical protein AVDCRST_MAG27-893, partial [uncultured Craurococcus sp.]
AAFLLPHARRGLAGRRPGRQRTARPGSRAGQGGGGGPRLPRRTPQGGRSAGLRAGRNLGRCRADAGNGAVPGRPRPAL